VAGAMLNDLVNWRRARRVRHHRDDLYSATLGFCPWCTFLYKLGMLRTC